MVWFSGLSLPRVPSIQGSTQRDQEGGEEKYCASKYAKDHHSGGSVAVRLLRGYLFYVSGRYCDRNAAGNTEDAVIAKKGAVHGKYRSVELENPHAGMRGYHSGSC